eukprot:7827113-Lingulodinium_polyedra.AAC.1
MPGPPGASTNPPKPSEPLEPASCRNRETTARSSARTASWACCTSLRCCRHVAMAACASRSTS